MLAHTFDTPVLLIVFNRPDLTQRVLTILKENRVDNLFIAFDAPRYNSQEEVNTCKAVQEMIYGVDWATNIRILARQTNLGCGHSISQAIDWFFTHVEEGIILEDDCLPSSSFFSFSQRGLNDFREDKSIWQIDGSNFYHSHSQNLYEYSSFPLIWGWATWKDRWDSYRFNFTPQEASNIIINQFDDHLIKAFWLNRIKDFFSNAVDTWDYQWMLTIWKNNGKVVRPPVNLVQNDGFSSRSTHFEDDRYNYLSQKAVNFNLNKYLPNTVVDYDFKLDELQFRGRFMKGSRVHSFLFFINDNFIKTIRGAIRFN